MPCVACGTTTAVMLLLKGQVVEAILQNLNILFLVPCVFIYTFSLLSDVIFHQHHTLYLYNKVSSIFKRRRYLYCFLLFELVVWTLHFV